MAEDKITDVYKLVEHCRYGNLYEEIIRDHIVVSIRDAKLSEKLQLDPNLTLDKTITQVRQNEEIKRQQPIIRREKSEVNVDAVITKRTSKARMTSQRAEGTAQRTQGTYNTAQKIKQMDSCKRCGKSPQHPKKKCPARESECKQTQKERTFCCSLLVSTKT